NSRKPDLKILDIYFYPNKPVVDELFNGEIRVKITNQGNSAIQAMEGECPYVNSLKYISDGTVSDWLNTDHRTGESIMCGKTISGDMEIVYGLKDFKFSSSQLTLTSNIDSSNKIDELDETNNFFTKTTTINSGIEIKNLKITEISETSATISWESDRMVNNIYYYRKQGDSNWMRAGGRYQTSIHSAVMYNLTPGTTYEYYIDVEDGAGNEFKSEVFTFSTSGVSFVEKPDLVVRGVHLPSAEDKRFIVEVRNQGNTATSFPDGIKISASVRNSDNSLITLDKSYGYVDNLEPNRVKNIPFYITGDLSEEIELKIWIDNAENGDGGFIDESNENNNILTKTIIMNQGDDENEDYSDDDSGNNNNDDDSGNDNSNTNQLVLQLQRQITALEKQVITLEKKLTNLDQKFANKYSGTMFLDVENNGRLWYVDPASKNRFYFENGASALSIGSKLATGVTYEDIQKIPVGVSDKLYNLKDSDNDGLPDRLESALGSDPNKSDSDSDGFSDKEELENGYSPIDNNKYNYNQSLTERLEGKMLLQVSGPNSHGEIWYIKDGMRWYGGTEDSMYEIMKGRSLGATSDNIRKIEVGDVVGVE
nr:fibronectin type III domain-containing protein [Patescibacteria group bacterium]